MSVPHPSAPPEAGQPRLIRWAIWVAIGALIAAAVVCVVWVLIGPENGIVGRAFLTILLLTGFAGVTILDAHLAAQRPQWFVLTSMIVWVVTLLLGAFLIWMPARGLYGLDGFARLLSFLLIVLVLQLAVLHVRLYIRAHLRHVTGFSRAITIITVALVGILAVLLVLPLGFHEYIDFRDLYWRFVVAVSILAAVGTALIPLINALFAPRRPRPVVQPAPGHPVGPGLAPWPTFADGFTPLPVLPDGSPDWNAYYTGYPTHPVAAPSAPPAPAAPEPAAAPQPGYPQPNAAPAPQPPVTPPAPGYQGYPPPPPPPQ